MTYIPSAGGSSLIDVQKFGPDFSNGTTTGSNTWTKPTGFTPKIVEVWICGGGQGAGSGAKEPSGTATSGGAGGAGAELVRFLVDPASLSATQAVVIGAGSAGGVAVTANGTAGNYCSTQGDNSTFGVMTARGGGTTAQADGGKVGGASSGGATGASLNRPGGAAGAASSGSADGSNAAQGTAAAGVPGFIRPYGGGGGGGITTGPAAKNGGHGSPTGSSGDVFASIAATQGTTGGASPSSISINSGLTLVPYYTGGGGGASSTSGNAQAGAAGKFGSGGGGGGSSLDSVGNAGAGGKGGDGFCVVISYG